MQVTNMKFFNINDTKEFFYKLTGCEGDVDLVNPDGGLIALITNGQENLSAMAVTDLRESISEIEFNFSDKRDAFYMAEYVLAR